MSNPPAPSRLLVLRTTRPGLPLDLWLADVEFVIVSTGTRVNRSSLKGKLRVDKINETHISVTIH